MALSGPKKKKKPSSIKARRKGAAATNGREIDVGPLDQYLGYYVRRIFENYRQHFMRVASEFQFGPREAGAAFIIGLNPGLTPAQLREALSMDGAQITALLNLFERRGFIERRVSATDGRSRHVYMTGKGEAMLQRLRRVVAWFDRSFSGDSLTDRELKHLIRLLAKLHAGFSAHSA